MPRRDPPSGFRLTWVLVDELALAPAPREERHLQRMQREGVAAVLSLCSEEEAPPPQGMEQRFRCARSLLPDHRSGRMPVMAELEAALSQLERLRQQGPVMVHCVAAMERSPLLCLAWLVQRHGLTPLRALDYLQQQHPGTSPLPGQLQLLADLRSCSHSDSDPSC